MGPAAVLLTAVSAGIQAMGAISQGNAARASANRQAEDLRRSATVVQQNTDNAVATANIAAADKARENRRILAANRAAFGSSGVDLSGTPLDVLSDTSMEMALDERRVAYEGQVQARQGALQILGLQEQADTSIAAGKNARNAAVISAGSSLLGGGANAAKMGVETGAFA